MHRGYIALWRKIEDHPFYKERRVFSKYEAWIDILMQVQHSIEDQEVILGMEKFVCKYGESLKSLRTWAIRWGWSPTKVKRFFNLLEKMKQIRQKSETITTRISVLNYSKYDIKRNANETQTKQHRNTNETTPLTDKNDKNVKNDKNKKNIQKKDLKNYLKEKIIENNLIETKDKIYEFFDYRMSMQKKDQYKTEKGINGLIRNLTDCRKRSMIISECLDIAMERDWKTPDPNYFNNNKPKTIHDQNRQACIDFVNGD